MNTFGYVGGNPVVWVDFFGLKENDWNAFQSAVGGKDYPASQVQDAYWQNKSNIISKNLKLNTTNDPYVAGQPAAMAGLGLLVDLVNSYVNQKCFERAVQMMNEINQKIEEKRRETQECKPRKNTWEVYYEMDGQTGCVNVMNLQFDSSSVYDPNRGTVKSGVY